MEIIGREIEVGVGVESTRGTALTSAEKWIKNVTADIVEKAEHVVDDATRGRLEDADSRRVVKKWIEGNLEGIAFADMIGYLFYNLYGSVSSAVVTGAVYDHEFTLDQSIQHASLTLFAKDGSVRQQTFNNGMVGTLELTASVDDFVRFSASFMASLGAANTDTPSYDTEYDFIGRDITVKVAATEAGLPGATATKIKDLNITFDAQLISDHILGSYTPNDIYNSGFSIEGSFTKNFDDETFKDLYESDVSQYIEITIEGAADIGGGNFPTITILMNRARVMDWTRSGGNDELVTEDVSFKAFYQPTDTQASKITVRNLTTEYSI